MVEEVVELLRGAGVKRRRVVRAWGRKAAFPARPIGRRSLNHPSIEGITPTGSVCDRTGRCHAIHAAAGLLFAVSPGFNPILPISAVGAWVAAGTLDTERPESSLWRALG